MSPKWSLLCRFSDLNILYAFLIPPILLFLACCVFSLQFYPEDRGNMFLRKVGQLHLE
jgi:hypothetical protein